MSQGGDLKNTTFALDKKETYREMTRTVSDVFSKCYFVCLKCNILEEK